MGPAASRLRAGSEEPRTAAASAAHTHNLSARRIAAYALVTAAMFGLALYAFHLAEQFLIRDARFALNGPEGSEDTPTLLVSGARHASRKAIESVFSEDAGKSVYLIPLSDRRISLEAVDWIKDASVARLWSNRILVRITERVPVAFVTLSSSKFALMDDEGVILPAVPDRFRLPVLAGVRPSDSLALRRSRVQRMLRMTSELGEAAQAISEIDVSDRDNLKVTQPYEGRVLTLLLGDQNFSKRYDNFVRHYDEIRRRLPGAATLDLRLEDRITVVE